MQSKVYATSSLPSYTWHIGQIPRLRAEVPHGTPHASYFPGHSKLESGYSLKMS
jgi:hypothetical protein